MTPTPTDTPTPTPTPTPTATANYYLEMLTPAGEGARVDRTLRLDEFTIILLLFAVLVSIWLMYLYRLRQQS